MSKSYAYYSFSEDPRIGFKLLDFNIHIGPSEDRVTNRKCIRKLKDDKEQILKEVENFNIKLNTINNKQFVFINSAIEQLEKIGDNIENGKYILKKQIFKSKYYCCGIIKKSLPEAIITTYKPWSLSKIFEEKVKEESDFKFKDYEDNISKYYNAASTVNINILKDKVTEVLASEESSSLVGQVYHTD